MLVVASCLGLRAAVAGIEVASGLARPWVHWLTLRPSTYSGSFSA